MSLQELKDIELDIFKMFDAFCKENNITYYLSHGTLLGAIRYKKFIPWDDDVDLLIPRADYDRMISLFKDSERYHLFAFEKNNNYLYPIAKLCDMTTVKIEDGYNNGVKLGVDIDLFPLDAWDNDLEKAKKEVKRIKRLMLCLGLTKVKKVTDTSAVKRFAKSLLMIVCKILGGPYFIRKIQKVSCPKGQTGDVYLGAKTWCVYGEKGIIPAEVFANTVDVEFEGQMFPAPVGYDVYLTCLYGDYMPEPPKEKQKTHHTFKAYKL